MSTQSVQQSLRNLGNAARAQQMQRYFQAGKGQYAEGDLFFGVNIPEIRRIVLKHFPLSFDDMQSLIDSPYHEARLAGFLALVILFQRSTEERELLPIVLFYLKNAKRANNWDLTDLSCHEILGTYLLRREDDRDILHSLAESDCLWEQRIAIVSTLALIRQNIYVDALALAEKLSSHPHHLIHKAIGWILREVGKQDRAVLDQFLAANHRSLPRVSLRAAIEHYPPEERARWMIR
jgi:3-methyladenine DNA glycosylase AlkD